VTYTAFRLNGFDDQEKPDVCENSFPSFKIKISCLQYEASFLSTAQTKYCASLTTRKYTFWQAFCSVPGCQTCMCKRGISQKGKWKRGKL